MILFIPKHEKELVEPYVAGKVGKTRRVSKQRAGVSHINIPCGVHERRIKTPCNNNPNVLSSLSSRRRRDVDNLPEISLIIDLHTESRSIDGQTMCDFTEYGTPSDAWVAAAPNLPPRPEGLSMLEMRDYTNNLREKEVVEVMTALGLGPRVRMRDHAIPTRDGALLEARTYRPADIDPATVLPVYFHLHGGGFHFGTLATSDATCAGLALLTRSVVFNVNYRHTPEHPYPTAWDDTQDAFEWLHDHIGDEETGMFGDPQRVVMGGISAGAELTASFALQQSLGKAATSRPPLAGQILMIPALVQMECYAPVVKQLRDPSVSSYVQNKDAPILSINACKHFTKMLKLENPDENDVRLNPGNATAAQVKGLPPTVFGIAGFDPLRDEGTLYAKRLAEAG